MALFNLQADLPTRRLFCFTIVCFRRLIPSGSVPGDVSVDYGEKLWRGGEEAGSDCVFQSSSRVQNAKSVGSVVISFILLYPNVKCISTADK
jgi:hypothetical protein